MEKGAADLLDAATEIASAVLQVKKGTEQIAAAAQEAEKASSEAASAAEQQSKGAEEAGRRHRGDRIPRRRAAEYVMGAEGKEGAIMTEEMLERTPESENYEDGDAASDTRQFVAFLVGGEVFAVDMAPVQEIIRVPEVVRVPLAPPALEGLSNLRGRVLPIISLRRVFGFPEHAYDDSTRAIVINIGQALGFIVDKVSSVISVEPQSIEAVEGIRSTVNSELLTGIIKDVGGFKMIMALDFSRLIAREFADIAALTASAATATETVETVDDDGDDELQLVSFSVCNQEYAIDIADVQEIVQAPETIVQAPNSPPHVLGLMTLRERILPLVGLRSLFNLPEREIDETSRIVVVDSGLLGGGNRHRQRLGGSAGSRERRGGDAHSSGRRTGSFRRSCRICRLNDGKRLVSIISVENMFRHVAVQDSLKTVDGERRNDAGIGRRRR